MTTGITSETSEVNVELEKMLDNLRFMCRTPSGFNSVKYEYYKEKLLSQYLSESLNDDIVEQEERVLATPIESPSSPIVSMGGPMDSPWSMKCHDVHHTSQSPYSTADNPYDEKWRFRCDWVEGGTVIDKDGNIYFGDFDDYLYALYPNGTLKWKYKTGSWIWSTPAIADDGTIYVGSWGTGLYAINPDGTKKWRIGIGGSIASSPAIAEDGTIYVGHMDNDIVAVNPNGTIKWRYKTGYHVVSCPAIGEDGTVYCGSGDTYLYALYPNGTLKWRFKTGKDIKGPPSIADDGTIYIGSWDDYLYALYPNGTMKWKCKIGQGTETNPSIANDGTIYVGSYDGHLYAVNPNGTMKWSFSVKTNIHQSSPAISADGTIYVGTDGEPGYIYAVNPNGTERWRKKIAKKWVESSPSIAEDGTVYIGCSYDMGGGYHYAFGYLGPNPLAPTINGPATGKPSNPYTYTFTSIDPDEDQVSYYIEWGDGDITDWTAFQASGTPYNESHTWTTYGAYTIRAKARDTDSYESEWGTLTVTMPRDKSTNNVLFWRLLERFPLLERLLLFLE